MVDCNMIIMMHDILYLFDVSLLTNTLCKLVMIRDKLSHYFSRSRPLFSVIMSLICSCLIYLNAMVYYPIEFGCTCIKKLKYYKWNTDL